MATRHLKQIGKVKNLDRWVPRDLTERQKNRCLEESSALKLCNSYEPFFDHIVVCYEKWILYNNWQQPAQWLNWEEAPKHFLKPTLHQKKVVVTVWWSSAGLIHYSFLSPGETVTFEKYAQQIDEMHWKLCLQPALVSFTTVPDCVSQNQCFRSWTNWATKFCLICHIHLTSDLPVTSSSILTNFCREDNSTTSKRQKK